MSRTVIDNTGVVTYASGDGVTFNASVSYATAPVMNLSTLTSSSAAPLTMSSGGAYTVTGTGATQVVMPTAASVPGAVITVRSLSAQAHFLTGSQEASGVKVFAGFPGVTPGGEGSKLALPAVVGSSVALVSDGNKFLVMAASGSFTISGT